MAPPERDSFLESLMDTNLYSMGAYFSDQHPVSYTHLTLPTNREV